MDKFLVLLFGSVAAYLTLRYRRYVRDFTGEIGFAERYLGVGGTNTFIVILGILIFIGSLMYALGTLQALLGSTIGRFFGA